MALLEELPGQPVCPTDHVVMRDVPEGWRCPACGHTELVDLTIEHPGDGPDVAEFRRGW